MPSVTYPASYERILLYDADRKLAGSVCDSLKDRGYRCVAVYSAGDCVKEIDSGDFKVLFIGRCEDELKLFDVVGRR